MGWLVQGSLQAFMLSTGHASKNFAEYWGTLKGLELA